MRAVGTVRVDDGGRRRPATASRKIYGQSLQQIRFLVKIISTVAGQTTIEGVELCEGGCSNPCWWRW